MWNFNFVVPSLMILIILLLYYLLRPRLPIRMNRTFLVLLVLELMTIFTDILSSTADEYFDLLPVPLLYVLNLAFFALYVGRIFWFYLFTLDVLGLHDKPHRWIYQLTPFVFLLTEAVVLSTPLTHAVFLIDETGYHRGTLYSVLYVCAFFYLFAALVLLVTYGRGLSVFDLVSLLGCQLILLMGNVARILLPQHLVMNTFCLMALLVLYLSFENPDLYISLRGSAFNARAFRDLLNEWNGKKSYQILGMVICNYNEKRGIYGSFQMDQSVVLINRYLTETFPDALVFYLRNGCFALVGGERMNTELMCRRIAHRFRQSWNTKDTDLTLTAGFVQASSGSCCDSVDRLVNTLLIALDRAGHSAGPQEDITIPETIQAIDRDLEVKRVLERALEEDRVEVFLQPLIDARTRRPVAAEALARIRGEDGALISPAVFVPLAEKNGRIIPLGSQVFRKTCAFIRENNLTELGISWINVNLSPLQCMNRNLAQSFSNVLLEYDVPADAIHLEITEESMIDYSLLQSQIEALQGEGFEFALDDYGSGYSNLTRVKQYPFKHIKIDMSVVRDYFWQRDQLLPTLIQVFKQMNCSVTAEGIETAEMADALTEIGCDYLQGFHFSRPVPFDQFLELYGQKK